MGSCGISKFKSKIFDKTIFEIQEYSESINAGVQKMREINWFQKEEWVKLANALINSLLNGIVVGGVVFLTNINQGALSSLISGGVICGLTLLKNLADFLDIDLENNNRNGKEILKNGMKQLIKRIGVF